jgi:hypothetical protein
MSLFFANYKTEWSGEQKGEVKSLSSAEPPACLWYLFHCFHFLWISSQSPSGSKSAAEGFYPSLWVPPYFVDSTFCRGSLCLMLNAGLSPICYDFDLSGPSGIRSSSSDTTSILKVSTSSSACWLFSSFSSLLFSFWPKLSSYYSVPPAGRNPLTRPPFWENLIEPYREKHLLVSILVTLFKYSMLGLTSSNNSNLLLTS